MTTQQEIFKWLDDENAKRKPLIITPTIVADRFNIPNQDATLICALWVLFTVKPIIRVVPDELKDRIQ